MISSDVFSDLDGSGISGMALATLVLGFGNILGPRGQIKLKIWDNRLCLTRFMCVFRWNSVVYA